MTGEKTLPPPYPIRTDRGLSPFCIRCNEIDEAALLIQDAEAFAAVAHSDEVLEEISDPSRGFCFLEEPDGPYIRNFSKEDGCLAFRGVLNAGSTSSVLCALTDVQLHSYCSVKFCEKGRRVYCPIWREKGEKRWND